MVYIFSPLFFSDKATPAKQFLKQGADLLTASSPFSIQESSTAEPSPLAVETVFSDSSIQHIIDKYTEELNISLRNTGDNTGKVHILLEFEEYL